MEKRNRIYLYLPIILAVVLILGIWLGSKLSFVSNDKIENVLFVKPSAQDKVEEIINIVQQDYVDSVSRQKLTNDAIEGILDSLDPHTQYIPADELTEVEDELNSNFEGIGIQFRIEKDTIMVIQVIQGGPSEKAGLMAGDRIVKINDSLVAGTGITSSDAVHLLKGKRGSQVKVSVLRRGLENLIDFTIIRDVIPTHSIDIAYMVNDSVGYIKLSRFAANTYEEFQSALNALLQQGMTALIFDLRGNSGGYLQAAIRISDEFLPDNELIVYTEGFNRPSNYAYATRKGLFEQGTLEILIDETSASASEIVAGAVQDNDRGLIIGRRSFGKGLVQEQFPFSDGSALRLTIARYHTPSGRNIQRPYNKGVKEYYEELYERYLDGEMQNADSVPINDTVKYYTREGRVVYGGGGIMPDIYVALKSNEKDKLYNKLIHQSLIFQYAFDYTDKNRASLQKYETAKDFIDDFEITDDIFKGLTDYIKGQGVKYSSKELRDSKEKIKVLLKAYIGRNLLDDAAFYPVYHQVDKIFLMALDTIEK